MKIIHFEQKTQKTNCQTNCSAKKGILYLLKSVMYYLLFCTTALRFADMIYILSKESTNLPIPVIVVTCAMILYGIALVVSKFVAPIRMKQVTLFYLVQSAMIVFNLIFVAVACPLSISAAETFLVGTFLDLLVNAGILFVSVKRMRAFSLRMPVSNGSMNA